MVAMAAGLYTRRGRHGYYCSERRQKKGGVELTGTVKFFNAQKGYGFIAGDNGSDYFIHFTGIAGSGYRILEAGQRVEFAVSTADKGLKAVDAVVLDD